MGTKWLLEMMGQFASIDNSEVVDQKHDIKKWYSGMYKDPKFKLLHNFQKLTWWKYLNSFHLFERQCILQGKNIDIVFCCLVKGAPIRTSSAPTTNYVSYCQLCIAHYLAITGALTVQNSNLGGKPYFSSQVWLYQTHPLFYLWWYNPFFKHHLL